MDEDDNNLYKYGQNGWYVIGNIKGDKGEDGNSGQDGATILSGVLDPSSAQGKDEDIYLNSLTQDLFHKQNGIWVKICNIRGEKGDLGATPYIGENGNWWISGSDTGYLAVGKDGTSSSISIGENGNFYIDGEDTGYSANLSTSQLYTLLEGVIEFDDTTEFKVQYESISGYETLDEWEYSTAGYFAGWAGSIGKPENVSVLKFRIKAQDTPITQIQVYLTKTDKTGEMIEQATLDVNVAANSAQDIIWILNQTYVNSQNTNLYFGYCCNAAITKYGSSTKQANLIPEEEREQSGDITYAMVSRLGFPIPITSFATITNSQGAAPRYAYMPVQVGTMEGKFKLSQKAVNEVLAKIDIEGDLYPNTHITLPSTIYGYKDQTLQIYFRNICAYPIGDVYIKVVGGQSGNQKGLQYSDRWEYTPKEAENFPLTIQIFSKNWNLLSESQFNVVIKDSTAVDTAKILIIGDSTVAHGQETAAFTALSQQDQTFDVTLIGTLGTGVNLHEGRSGWSANGYVNSNIAGDVVNPFYNEDKKSFDFSYYMKTATSYDLSGGVDVVFLQLGINDIISASDVNLTERINTYIANMRTIVDSIHAYNPSIKVVINPIIPCDDNQDTFVQAYNSQTVWGYMRNMWQTNNALLKEFSNQSNIYISWYNAAIDGANNQGGNVHPNNDGYLQLANQMYYMLKAII